MVGTVQEVTDVNETVAGQSFVCAKHKVAIRVENSNVNNDLPMCLVLMNRILAIKGFG